MADATPPTLSQAVASPRFVVGLEAQGATGFTAQLLKDEGFGQLPFNYSSGEATPLDARKMQQILDLPIVKGDVARFVSEVMIESPLIFSLGREAKMAVMAELGRAGALEVSNRFAEAFSGQDHAAYLKAAYAAAAEGRPVPTYLGMVEGTRRMLSSGFTAEAPAPQPEVLIARYPHLQRLKAGGFDVEAVLSRRTDLASHLEAGVGDNSKVTLVMNYHDLPLDGIRGMAEQAVLLGYGEMMVAENHLADFAQHLRATGTQLISSERTLPSPSSPARDAEAFAELAKAKAGSLGWGHKASE